MNRKQYLALLQAMTGITECQMEEIIRPVYERDGHDAAKRKLKEISGQPLVETHVIVKTYFEELPARPASQA
jgi:hypothetical protein